MSEPGPKVARSLEDVAELEAAGAEVLLLTADAGVPDELRRALGRCREHFGTLTGVIHVAGVPAGGMVQRRTVAEAEGGARAQGPGDGPLAELVGPDTPAEERPELLVLYSSAVTAFGGIGEGDYCAANTVLDAYGAALAATRALHQGGVGRLGPVAARRLAGRRPRGRRRGLAERVSAYRERYGFAEEAGCALLDRIVTGGHGSVVAARQPLRDVLREWSAMIDLDALVGAGGGAWRGAVPAAAAAHRVRGAQDRDRDQDRRAVAGLSRHRAGRRVRPVLRPRQATPWSAWPWCSPSRRSSACPSRPRCCSSTRPSRSSRRRWSGRTTSTARRHLLHQLGPGAARRRRRADGQPG